MLALRRVAGGSMQPGYPPGRLVLVWSVRNKRRLRPGQVVIIRHDGLEKLKRLQAVQDSRVYVVGDNSTISTDSRHFGWLPLKAVQAVVIWPR